MNKIIHGENLKVLKSITNACATLIYIDPPFNTGRRQTRERVKAHQSTLGNRVGFGDRLYETKILQKTGYSDSFENYLDFLMPRIREGLRCLADNGSVFIHLDSREVHYIKVEMDKLLGKEHFINEIIWSYDYGARSKKRWSPKHDNILWYAKDPGNYIFNYAAIDRIPYMAPDLVGKEKAKAGKTPTDTWWSTIVPTQGKERTGYSTQKPLSILNRIVRVHSNEGETVLDYFAGSGSAGEAAGLAKRKFIMVDENPDAITIMKKRLEIFNPEIVNFNEIGE